MLRYTKLRYTKNELHKVSRKLNKEHKQQMEYQLQQHYLQKVGLELKTMHIQTAGKEINRMATMASVPDEDDGQAELVLDLDGDQYQELCARAKRLGETAEALAKQAVSLYLE
jgi:hypothetical protein